MVSLKKLRGTIILFGIVSRGAHKVNPAWLLLSIVAICRIAKALDIEPYQLLKFD